VRLLGWDRDFGVFFCTQGISTVGTGPALIVGSASYLVSVAGLAVLRKRFAPAPHAAAEPLLAAMRSGLRLMARDRLLRRDQLVWALYMALGSGIILGLVYVGSRGGTGGSLPATLAGAAAFGLGEGFLLVIHLTLRARATPEGYFGRVTSIAGVIGQAANGVSMAWLGLALRLAHGAVTFAVLGAALLALAAAVALAPAPPLPLAPADGPAEGPAADAAAPT